MNRMQVLLLLVSALICLTVPGVAQDLLFHAPNSEIFISSGGRLVIDNPTTARGMSRWVFMNFAVSQSNVFNFDDSIQTVLPAFVDSTSPGLKADFVAKHVASPCAGTLGSGPFTSSLHHVMWVHLWRDLKGLVVGYRLKNIGAAPLTGKLSLEVYPRIDQAYGGHYLRWRASDSIAYFYRPTLSHYVGAKLLTGLLNGVKLSTGSTFYQPGVSTAESQVDSVRNSAANYTGFDTAVDSVGTTSTPRSMIHMNIGAATIPAGDSTQWVYVALAYDVTEVGMVQALADVKSRAAALLTDVAPIRTLIPEAYALHQNYPNPFNPSTHIRFDIKTEGPVTLGVYDMLGREVRQLVNSRLAPGSYETAFDASGLPSGVYFYRLQAGSFSQTLKMALTK